MEAILARGPRLRAAHAQWGRGASAPADVPFPLRPCAPHPQPFPAPSKACAPSHNVSVASPSPSPEGSNPCPRQSRYQEYRRWGLKRLGVLTDLQADGDRGAAGLGAGQSPLAGFLRQESQRKRARSVSLIPPHPRAPLWDLRSRKGPTSRHLEAGIMASPRGCGGTRTRGP